MKKLMAVALVAALALACAPAHAAKMWDDMSWWGNTGATPAPVADSQGRSGYWWWPTDPASNVDDTELWGNRGIVYHSPWEQPAPPEPVAEPAPTPAPDTTRTVPVLNNILFDFDKSTLKPEGKAIADEAIAVMKEFGGDTVLIEGHTCNIGTDEYNMGLGQRRADSVASYLTSMGIDAGRVSTKSFGESTPAVPNDTTANRALNRRAVFQFTLGN
ncbi:MAG: OmpA family protein [Candidatus Hydrogenedens sp.]|nr:OmpA family protein [Candidatus Hydrogenedens sp.]